MVLKMVWQAPGLNLPVLPSTTKGGLAAAGAVGGEEFWFMKTSPWLMAGRLAG